VINLDLDWSADGVSPARAAAAIEALEEARAALAELLEGPTVAERDRGYLTNIPPDVGIRSLRVADDTAYADFDATLDRAAGSCRVMAIRAQIEATLLHLPAVREVVISVEGNVETALQP
jgi:spore germination protein GerM